MQTKTTNGTGTKTDATQPKDTQQGANLLKAVNKSAPNPMGDRILKISELQRKVMQLQRLREIGDDLRKFKVENEEGENESLSIRIGSGGRFETGNGYIVARVVECIQTEVNGKIPVLESEILTASL